MHIPPPVWRDCARSAAGLWSWQLGSSAGTVTDVVIMGEWLVVLHVIELVKLAMMRAEDLLEGRRHILQEMKSVGNLGGLWSPLPNACGIGFGAVTGHDRDVGMGLEPRGHGFSRPILEYVNGTPPLEIDDDGAVAMAFAPGPVIDANDLWLQAPRAKTRCAHAAGAYCGSPVHRGETSAERQQHRLRPAPCWLASWPISLSYAHTAARRSGVVRQRSGDDTCR